MVLDSPDGIGSNSKQGEMTWKRFVIKKQNITPKMTVPTRTIMKCELCRAELIPGQEYYCQKCEAPYCLSCACKIFVGGICDICGATKEIPCKLK